MEMMKRAPWLVIALLLLLAGGALGGTLGAKFGSRSIVNTITETVIQEVTPQEYQDLLAEHSLEPGGLRGFIEGIQERPPRVITIVDTLIPPPDTVFRFATVDSRGFLSLEMLSLRDSLYVPQLRTEVNVSDCDEGYSINNGRVVCDIARFGHLYAVPGAGLRGAFAGLEWERSYRSSWQFSAGRVFWYDRSQADFWEFRVKRRLRLW